MRGPRRGSTRCSCTRGRCARRRRACGSCHGSSARPGCGGSTATPSTGASWCRREPPSDDLVTHELCTSGSCSIIRCACRSRSSRRPTGRTATSARRAGPSTRREGTRERCPRRVRARRRARPHRRRPSTRPRRCRPSTSWTRASPAACRGRADALVRPGSPQEVAEVAGVVLRARRGDRPARRRYGVRRGGGAGGRRRARARAPADHPLDRPRVVADGGRDRRHDRPRAAVRARVRPLLPGQPGGAGAVAHRRQRRDQRGRAALLQARRHAGVGAGPGGRRRAGRGRAARRAHPQGRRRATTW